MIITIFVFTLFGTPGLLFRVLSRIVRDPDHRRRRLRGAPTGCAVPGIGRHAGPDGARHLAERSRRKSPTTPRSRWRSRRSRKSSDGKRRPPRPRLTARAGVGIADSISGHCIWCAAPARWAMNARPTAGTTMTKPTAGGPGVSRGDTDLPFAASGEQIRQREFATVRRATTPTRSARTHDARRPRRDGGTGARRRPDPDPPARGHRKHHPPNPRPTHTSRSRGDSPACSPRPTARPTASSSRPAPRPSASRTRPSPAPRRLGSERPRRWSMRGRNPTAAGHPRGAAGDDALPAARDAVARLLLDMAQDLEGTSQSNADVGRPVRRPQPTGATSLAP